MKIVDRLQSLKDKRQKVACCLEAAVMEATEGFALAVSTEDGKEDFLVRAGEMEFVSELIDTIDNVIWGVEDFLEAKANEKPELASAALDRALTALGMDSFKLFSRSENVSLSALFRIAERHLNMIETCLTQFTKLPSDRNFSNN